MILTQFPGKLEVTGERHPQGVRLGVRLSPPISHPLTDTEKRKFSYED